jgi:hypothetical protein
MRLHLLTATVLLLPGLAASHEGHGLPNPHWHASDLLGVAIVALVAGMLFWARRK